VAIGKDVFIATAAAGIELDDTEKKPAPRQRKADRPFSPPELGLRPSTLRVAERVLEHIQRTRSDQAYNLEFTRFYAEHLRHAADDIVAKAERYAGFTEPAPIRTRASGLKECSRQQVMRLVGCVEAEVGKDSPHWAVSAILGERGHELVEASLKFLQIARRTEFAVYTEAGDLSGRVDAELLEEPAILDIKTVGEADFKEGPWGHKVPGYIAQVSVYAALTGNTKGVILLVDRGSGRMSDFEWDVDKLLAQRMFSRAAKIVEYAKKRQLPRPEGFEKGGPSFKCRLFCPFYRQCLKQEEDGSVQMALDEGKDPRTL
jgi:hypothetical protein